MQAKAMGILGTLVDYLSLGVMAVGVILGIFGAIHYFEGHGNDNPGAKSQGGKQVGAGVAIAAIGWGVVPLIISMFQ